MMDKIRERLDKLTLGSDDYHCTEWLNKWIENSHNMALNNTSCFKKLNEPYTLYRGLSWGLTEEIKQLNSDKDLTKYIVGSNIYLSLNQFSSWTTLKRIAQEFSWSVHDLDSTKRFGIVLETVVDPKYVLVDVHFTFNIEGNGEAEVILHPSRYKCEIIQINNRISKDNNKDLSFGMYKDANIDSDYDLESEDTSEDTSEYT